MRPFFSYFGSKHNLARFYEPPRHDIVIEPFAGSACYSTYWNPKKVILFDLNPHVVAAWKYLISVSEEEIRSLPDKIASLDDHPEFSEGAKAMLPFWLALGTVAPQRKAASWASQNRQVGWRPNIKDRIIRQLPHIRHWEVHHASYESAPDIEAHWFVDPPYQTQGHRYPFGGFHKEPDKFRALGEWCRSRKGYVEVCESEGADWLPFEPLKRHRPQDRTREYTEVVWRNYSPQEALL